MSIRFSYLVAAAFALVACSVYTEDLLEEDDGDGTGATGAGNPGGLGGVGGANTGGVGNTGTGGMPTGGTSSTSTMPTTGGMGGTGGAGGGGIAWVNELHYDNDVGDVDEGVEIAGTAGLSLVGWSVELYNGATGSTYDSIPLTGVIPDQQNGIGCIWFPNADIQNGGPDGLALVDAQGLVVQFLSYEGTMTATNGPANGMSSTDIGVAEDSSPLGESLQLAGTGNTYASFTWSGPVGATPNAPNVGQTFN